MKYSIKNPLKKLRRNKISVEFRLRERLNFLISLEKTIRADMKKVKPSELAGLREEHDCLQTLIAEFQSIIEGK